MSPRAAACALGLLATLGCSEAILSFQSHRTHDAYTDASLARFQEASAQRTLEKGDVLATLGPPILAIPQDDGDIFVYRRFARETRILNVNPSFVSYFGPAPPIPLYFNSHTTGRDDLLMVFFDAEGRMRGAGARYDVEGDRPRFESPLAPLPMEAAH